MEETDKVKEVDPSLDEKDQIIINCVKEKPEMLLAEIPLAINKDKRKEDQISYPTVQRRIQQMTNSLVLGRGYTINWAKAGYLVRYRVGILIDPVALDKPKKHFTYDSQNGLADYIRKELPIDERFKDKLIVDDVYVLLGGRVDLAVDFFARDDKTATKFIIDGLRKLPGISNTASAKLAYSSKYGWLSKNGDE